jgi:RNA polymerase sigma-70 factor (ECF subfamily)
VDATFTDELVALLPRLRRFARALTRSAGAADDLVQDACERALANAHAFTPGSRLDSWLFKILQNRWLDQCRSAAARAPLVPIDEAFDLEGADGRRDGEARLTLRALAGALDELPPEQRLVLVAVCVDGLSYKEAAELLEVPIGTVMSRLARARLRLQEKIFAAEEPVTDAARA